jgi:flavorubredoxin
VKALVVYESMFGNTEAIAKAVADRLSEAFEVTLSDVREMPPAHDVDLLVVGAPTHAWGLSRPTTRIDATTKGTTREGATEIGLREYLNLSPTLPGVAAAAFDTRIDKAWAGSAARKAHRELRRLGCRTLLPAKNFAVTGTTGPLVDGEQQRSGRWAAELTAVLLTERRRV